MGKKILQAIEWNQKRHYKCGKYADSVDIFIEYYAPTHIIKKIGKLVMI